MTWLTEDPFWPLAVAASALVIILIVMFATGRWALWKPAAGVIVLVLLVALIERLVVTDRERIELVMDRAVQAALRHDVPAIEALIEPQAKELRRQIRMELARGEIEQLRITHEVVRVNHATTPPSATADLIVRLAVRAPRVGIEDLPPIAVKIQLQKHPSGWLVSGAEAEDLRTALGSMPR
jgi:low affinity Fe/Cu permease